MQFIYVVRHGETMANNKGQINDKNVIISLNELGKKQATKTGKYFKKIRKCDNCIIYSSPSIRSLETANLIASELKIDKIIQDSRINELDHGLLSGTTKDDKINKDYMKDFNKLPKDPIDLELSFKKFDEMVVKKFKHESIDCTKRRLKSFYNSLPKNKNIIVVTHGGITSFTILTLFNILPAGHIIGDISNGKNCTIMCITKEKNKYQLLSLPNTKHLK